MWDLEVDLACIGAGVGSLASAISTADLGADAVLVVGDRVQADGLVGDLPPSDYYLVGEYWTRSIETISGRQIVAVAIKYGTLPMTGRTDYLMQ